MMKTTLIFAMTLLLAASMASTAHADAIASPVDAAVSGIAILGPWILVGAAVGVTVYLLKKFWGKRK